MFTRALCAAVAAAGMGIGLAPIAGAEPTPPVPEGMYNQTLYDGSSSTDIHVRWDCGAGCFTVDGLRTEGPGTQFRFDPASGRWYGPWVDFEAPCAGEVIGTVRYYYVNDLRSFDEHDATKAACGVATPEEVEATIDEQDQNDTIPWGTLVPV